MNEFCTYLKELRANKPLKQLALEINTTDKILSHLENGKFPKNTPELFNSLATFYNINVIELYLKSGFISNQDLNEYNGSFKNCDELDDHEIEHIQNEIDFIVNHKK